MAITTTPSPIELVLADAYRDVFQQLALEAAGQGTPGDAGAALQVVREAERQCPTRDAVYAAAKSEWETVMRLDAITGHPLRASRPSASAVADPQGRLL